MTSNNNNLSQLLQQVRQINTITLNIIKKIFDAAYSALTEEIKSRYKTPKFGDKVGDRVRIAKCKNISKGYTKNW